jgi:predicted secreted protein
MSWYTGFATYAINWGLVMFMVLPWGVRRIDPEDLSEGDDPGAPANPRILLRAAITTVAAAVIFCLIYVVFISGVFSFRV